MTSLQLSFRMDNRQIGRTVARIVGALVLIGTSCLGGYNAIDEWNEPVTLLQRSVSVGSVVYALVGLIAGFGLVLRQPWSFAASVFWGAVVAYTGTAAVIGYDPGATLPSVLAAFGICVLIGAVVAWLARIGSRREGAKT
jgi:hypothetical protein